jgi:two-component system CheB/CheR fusion protein
MHMISTVRSPAIPYVVAILVVGAAAVLTRLMWPVAYPASLAPLFLIAVAISTWFGGVGPGLTATCASFGAIAGLVLLLGDVHELKTSDLLRIASLLPVAMFIGLLYQAKTRAEQALRERDARLQLVSEQIPGGLWSTDAELRVTSGFGARSAILHGPAGTTLQQHFQSQDNSFEPVAAHRRALRGDSSSYELHWCGRTFQCYVEPLRGLDGGIIGVVGIATDITDRKYAEQEREQLVNALETQHARLNAIVESIPAGIVVAAAPDGRIVLHNSRVEEVLRHQAPPSANLAAYSDWHAHHPDGRKVEPHEYPLARGLRGEIVRHAEFVYHRGDGTQGWIQMSGAPVRDSHGEIVGSVAIFSDVDQAKRAEEEIRQAKLQLEQANQAKDRFLAMLSHELRTPLTPVLALATAMADRADLSAQMREDAETICRNVNLQACLIDDLLDVTRISRGKLQLHPQDVDCHDLVHNAADICTRDGAQKGVAVVLDLAASSHFVHGDAARLQQVFWNLIKNGIKFTAPGGRVTVRSYDEGGDLCVEVSDTGIGIEADVLPRIFDAFEQGAASITRKFGGLGLGLAISKALVEAHGGTITVESAGPGKGTTFRVRQHTVQPAVLHRKPGGVEEAASAHPLKILLVEDHADSAKVMQRLLGASGHHVETAGSVEAALRALEHEPVDLLISDVGLPDGSGLDLMREVSNRYGLKGIALSGFGTEEDVQRSLAAGFVAHLTKPVPMSSLHSAIARVAGAGS